VIDWVEVEWRCYHQASCPHLTTVRHNAKTWSGTMSLETVEDARRVARLGRAEHENLLAYLERLPADGWTEPSACADWRVYQVVSHLGSAPQIAAGSLRASLRGAEPMTDDQRKAIWARFDSLKPDEVLPAFRRNTEDLYKLVESLTDDELSRTVPWIGARVPVARMLAGRLNEQTLHAWDIRWARDKQATLSLAPLPDLLQVNIEPPYVSRMARPERAERLVGKTVLFLLSQPDEALSMQVQPDGVTASQGRPDTPDVTVELPSESFIRLIWGRYDILDGLKAGRLELSQPDQAEPLQALFPGR